LRIGVDFHVFDGKFQGSRSHLLGLFAEMVARYPIHQFYFFLEDTPELGKNPAFRRANVNLVHMPNLGSLVRLLWQLPRMRRHHRLDVLHCQYVIPPWPARGNAVTIHDILYENYPQYFTRSFVFRARLLMRWSARKAALLCTVSDYSRAELARCYGIPEKRIVVLHNAIDPARFYPGVGGSSYIRQRGLTSRGFILAVGRIEPRKNYPALLHAYARMTGEVPPLVIVGQRDFNYSEFDRVRAAMPSTCDVRILSNVCDEELPALYRHALVFAYPSFAEGFGMPVLEALASGTPVVTSSTTALPEVIGEAGLVVDPTDEGALAAALQRICSDPMLRERLVTAGVERARAFSWRQSAHTLANAYLSLED
jgi:glycosyltransferase involved in cell wall biosynthesis